MAITARNIVRHELIGLEVKVKKSTNRYLENLKGKVVDESRNMIFIETNKGVKSIPKKECIFVFKLPNKEKVEVDGKLLIGRPQDRIKKKLPRW